MINQELIKELKKMLEDEFNLRLDEDNVKEIGENLLNYFETTNQIKGRQAKITGK